MMMMMMMACKTILIVTDFIVFKHVNEVAFSLNRLIFVLIIYTFVCFFTGHCEEFIIRNSCCTEISLWI